LAFPFRAEGAIIEPPKRGGVEMNLRLIGKLFGLGVALALALILGGNNGQVGLAQVPDMLIIATAYDIESLDPAWVYDIASSEVILNIYEPLLSYELGNLVYDRFTFAPALATELTISPDGKTYSFKIRKGVKFHEGGDLSPDDVAYSLQRGLLQDREGGPQWTLLEPILGVSSIDELAKEVGDVKACEMVKEAISVQGDNVVIKLKIPFAPMLNILASSWGAVLDKEWMIAQGDWDGKCDNWRKWHDPAAEKSTIFNKANGTGPYKLEKWIPGEEIHFVRNENYWRNTTAAAEYERWGLAKVKNAVIKVVPEWGTRLAMFQAGAADIIIAVPRAFVASLKPRLVFEGDPLDVLDVRGMYIKEWANRRIRGGGGDQGILYKQPAPVVQGGFINFKVEEKSPFVPLLGHDKKPDLLSDIHMRRAFNYCFDTDTYIKEAWLGEAEQIGGVIIKGRLGYNPRPYEFSLEKCEAELKAAWDGKAWSDGFQVTLTYNTGNVQRKIAAELLEKNLESFNAKRGRAPSININVLDMPWPSYLKALDDEQLAVFWDGWWEDYPHPHDWVSAFMHSRGAIGGFQQFEVIKDVEFKPAYATFLPAKKYANLQELFDDLIEKALLETDLEKAKNIYFDLNKLAIDWAINISMVQLRSFSYTQSWVAGGWASLSFYLITKSHPGYNAAYRCGANTPQPFISSSAAISSLQLEGLNCVLGCVFSDIIGIVKAAGIGAAGTYADKSLREIIKEIWAKVGPRALAKATLASLLAMVIWCEGECWWCGWTCYKLWD
jgi:peptide/nickel transport system substrate-binding protein